MTWPIILLTLVVVMADGREFIEQGYKQDWTMEECLQATRTRSENLRRGIPHMGMWHKAKKFCVNGHPYNKANTTIYKKNGWRDCRTCRKATKQRYLERHA